MTPIPALIGHWELCWQWMLCRRSEYNFQLSSSLVHLSEETKDQKKDCYLGKSRYSAFSRA